MFKKLLFGTILLSSLTFGSNALASEISDIDDLQVKIEEFSKDRDVLISERLENLELKKKEDLLKYNVKSIGGLITSKSEEVTLNQGIEPKEESIEEKINKVTNMINEKDSEISKLSDKVNNLVKYESFLKDITNDIEYNLDDMSKEDLNNKLNFINEKIASIENYKIEVSDNSLQEANMKKLKEVKVSITKDIKEFKTDGQKVVEQAMKYLGVPYVWGGKSPDGMDCSGLTQLAYRHALGKEIGIWTVAQEGAGSAVAVSDAEVGDLLFWGGHGSTHHVAIYIGDGKFIHAPQPGDVVKITNLTDFMPDFALKVN